ncbi:MAG: hypothetical protein ACUVXA_01895 [Candidatus Jordarchaeum sp.]|uniref:hypothetical protein n=1 Tax=Candidatus Jordarchaeum sp. TaxID=2823881 RepID=UPI00404AB3C4
MNDAIKDLKGYDLDNFRSLISITNQSVSNFVSFFLDYIKIMKEAFDFLQELLKILGVKNVGEVLLRKVDLRTIVNPSEIDTDLLKFQLKTALEYSLPKLLELSNLVNQKSEKLYNSAKFIESEVIQNFKTSFDNIDRQGINLTKELYSVSEIIFNEKDPSKCVDLLIQTLESAIDLAIGLWQTTKFTPLFTKDWIEYNIHEITQTAEKFSEIKRDINILIKCRAKIYEHTVNCFMIILKALWNNNKIISKKVGKIMQLLLQDRGQDVNVSELIPPKIPVEDLSFALTLARGEFDLSKRASKRLMENIESLRLAGEWLKSPVLYQLYETIIKRVKVKEKYDEKILGILIELQNLTTKEESKSSYYSLKK